MSKIIPSEMPSGIYRHQIGYLARYMSRLIAQTLAFPLRSMTAFNQVKGHFGETEQQAYSCCSVMDTAQSMESGERAGNAADALMMELVHLKNKAGDIIDKNEEESSFVLEEAQKKQSSDLHQAQQRTADSLKQQQNDEVTKLLNAQTSTEETIGDSRAGAVMALSNSHEKAAKILKQSQTDAKEALDNSQLEAAAAMRESHARAAEKHEEKDQVISWMSGAYSVDKELKK